MTSLAELLSRDVQESLGISGILSREQQRAARTGQVQSQIAGIEAQAELRRQEEQRRREEERKRKKAGFLSTVGSIIGGAAGFVTGGPAGAMAGARLGGAAGGVVGGDAAAGTQLAIAGFDTMMNAEQMKEQAEMNALKKEQLATQIAGEKAKTKILELQANIAGSPINTLDEDQSKVITKAVDKFTASTPWKSAVSSLDDVNKAVSLLESGDPIAQNAAIVALVSSFQSRISDFDVQFQIDQGLLKNLGLQFSKVQGKGLDENTVNSMRTTLKAIQGQIIDGSKKYVDKNEERFKLINPNIPSEPVSNIFDTFVLEPIKVGDSKVDVKPLRKSGQVGNVKYKLVE